LYKTWKRSPAENFGCALLWRWNTILAKELILTTMQLWLNQNCRSCGPQNDLDWLV
jgi:hypothetical protein